MIVDIFPGCISCGVCVSINSEVFELNTTVHINPENVAVNEDDCRQAADMCPVNVIKIIEDEN